MSVATSPQLSNPDLVERLRRATLGRYDIYAELGRGGMAAVFLALDLALNRKVAVKVMLPELTAGTGTLERFRREARLAASLTHPHIIPVYAVGEDADLAWFVMKYVEGRSLDSVLAHEGAQSEAFVQAMLQQVGSALDYAHRHGVVHRDIKPANVLLDEGGWFLLTDFGIAKAADDVGLTSSGLLIGTPTYMSPEHFNGQEIGPAADQYALGCVGYELLTATRPFDGGTVGELMRAHLLDAPVPLIQRRPHCPAPLALAITRMLEKDPAQRFGTLADMVHAFHPASPDEQRVVTSLITTLARSGAERRPRISQPVSPNPLNRPVAPNGNGMAPVVVSGPLRGPLQRTGVGVLAFVAAAGVWATMPDSPSTRVPRTAPVGPVPGPDSVPLVADGQAPPPPYSIVSPPSDSTGLSARVAPIAGKVAMPRTRSTPPATRDTLRPDSAPAITATVTSDPVPNVPAGTPPPAPNEAWFSIKLLYPDLTLFVDNVRYRVERQKTVVVSVTPGRHRIEVRRNECADQFMDIRDFVAGDTVKYNNKGPCPEGGAP